jgi:uncharacterized membrane protein YvbJ
MPRIGLFESERNKKSKKKIISLNKVIVRLLFIFFIKLSSAFKSNINDDVSVLKDNRDTFDNSPHYTLIAESNSCVKSYLITKIEYFVMS